MKANRLIKLISIIFLLFAVSSSGFDLQAQTKGSHPVKRVEYEEIRDSLFPDFIAGTADGWGVGIWYRPCQGKELQLTMVETYVGQTEVILYTPVKDSLREQFKAYMKRHPNAPTAQVYPAMKVKEQVLPLSTAEIRSLRQEILDVMERSIGFEKDIWIVPVPGPTRTVRIHPECVGDDYTMRFVGVSHLTLSRGYNEYPPEAPFVTWMKEKRPTFEKWAMSASSK